jgi:hypothetical protein
MALIYTDQIFFSGSMDIHTGSFTDIGSLSFNLDTVTESIPSGSIKLFASSSIVSGSNVETLFTKLENGDEVVIVSRIINPSI